MPELPEVETIKRQLADKVIGLTIKNVLVKNANSFKGDQSRLQGLIVQGVSRRAKMIVIELYCSSKARTNKVNSSQPINSLASNNNLYLLIHLKMTGQLIYADKNGQFGGGHPIPPFGTQVPNKFTHIIFDFDDGSHLYFNDVRKFGWIKLMNDTELKNEFEKLGPEPLGNDFTLGLFKNNLLKHKNKPIKVVLMDPSVVAGIGNIYAVEACFDAKIEPDRKVSSLSDLDFENLFNSIKKILPLAIKYQGVSADNYVTLEGKMGDYYKKLWVYDREGENCPNQCGGEIIKTKLGGRGTYWCPACQK